MSERQKHQVHRLRKIMDLRPAGFSQFIADFGSSAEIEWYDILLDACEDDTQERESCCPVVIKRWAYFYQQNHCQAYKADDPACICWHAEGDGPYPNAKHDEKDSTLNWRAL